MALPIHDSAAVKSSNGCRARGLTMPLAVRRKRRPLQTLSKASCHIVGWGVPQGRLLCFAPRAPLPRRRLLRHFRVLCGNLKRPRPQSSPRELSERVIGLHLKTQPLLRGWVLYYQSTLLPEGDSVIVSEVYHTLPPVTSKEKEINSVLIKS